MAPRGGLELMTEMANLLLQCSRSRGVPGIGLSHVGRVDGLLDGSCEVGRRGDRGLDKTQSLLPNNSIPIYTLSPLRWTSLPSGSI